MKRATLLLGSLFVALTLAACSKSDDSQSSKPSDNQMASRADKGVTASDQPENDADRKIMQEVRQALMADSSLSTSPEISALRII